MTQSDYDNIPLIMTPFADSDAAKDYSFFNTGITHEMTVPVENGGVRFSRHQMNGIGYLATLGAYLDRMGYPYGRERLDPTSFGGYPKGAILMTQDDNLVREYVSLVDNNTHPLPRESTDGTYVGDEWWAPTIPTDSASFFPNFSSRERVSKISIGPTVFTERVKQHIDIGETAWYHVTRRFRFDTNEQITDITRLAFLELGISTIGENDSIGVGRLEFLNGTLGSDASCLIPLSANNMLEFDFYNGYRDRVNPIYCDVIVTKLNAIELQ